MSSSIPAITTQLLSIWGNTVDNTTKVVHGYDSAPELVSVFGAEFARKYLLLGGSPAPQDEDFSITVIVEVLRTSGRDMGPAVTRAWEIFDAIDEASRGDHTLDGLSWNALFEKGRQEFYQTDVSQGCRIHATLTGTARI